MRRDWGFAPLLGLVMLCIVLLSAPAYAYIDPNTTGLLTQVLGPILAVIAMGLTFLRKQVSSAIRWLFDRITIKR